MAARQQLLQGADELGLSLGEEACQRLLDYLALLQKWNRAYNLTAVRDPAAMVPLHLLDSLSIAPYLQGQRFLDVGSGAGLPGVPLAIGCPRRQFVLLDSNGKKARFLREVCHRLALDNVEVREQRIEHGGEGGFDGILSRAFASLADMARHCAPLLGPGGKLLAMKGQYPRRELSELAKPYIVEACHRLAVPGVDGERHLIIVGLDSGSTA